MDKNKELQRKQEDAAFAHGLWWVGGAILVEFLLVLINQSLYNFTTESASIARAQFAGNALRVLFVAAPLIFLGAIVVGYLQFKKTGTICRGIEGALGLSGAISLVCSMCTFFGAEGCTMMLLFVPAVGGLAFVFFLYQHDFFYSAALSGMGGMVLWMIWHQTSYNGAVVMIGVAKIIIIAGFVCWLATKLKKNEGVLTLLGHEIRILPQDAIYPIIYVSAGLMLAVTVIGFLMGGYVAYYLIYALAAWIFALMVYYTVRML